MQASYTVLVNNYLRFSYKSIKTKALECRGGLEWVGFGLWQKVLLRANDVIKQAGEFSHYDS
jgi:hypothetical protein